MKKLTQILSEQKEQKEKEKKLRFVETNPQEAFPNDTISYLQKEINKLAKDLSVDWKSPIELVNAAFYNLEVPIPKAFLAKRWQQYNTLFGVAIKSLFDARGFGADWSNSSAHK
jgi:hypothetical protein